MKLLTKKIKRSLPKLGATESIDDPIAQVKFFAPGSNWTWYVTEYDPESGTMFGLVYGHEAELGHFLLQELEAYRGRFGVKIERDMFWTPMPLSHCNDPCGRLDNPFHAIVEKCEPPELPVHPNCKCVPVENPIAEGIKVKAESGEEITLMVGDTIDRKAAAKYGSYLVSTWCECKESEFLCYPQDGCCTCGIHKHHVHCKKCGGVSQVG